MATLRSLVAGCLLLAACAGGPPPSPGQAASPGEPVAPGEPVGGAASQPADPGAAAAPRLLREPPGVSLTLARMANADTPAAFAAVAGAGLYVAELATGRILRDGREVADLAVSTGGESGLQSLAAAPDGTALYAYLSVPEGDPNDAAADGGPASVSRVVRMAVDADGGLGPPRTLLEVPGAGIHNAGSVAVGPDGRLYVNLGDNIRRGAAQDLGSPFGKILRLTLDGDAAPGKPFAGLAGADPRVWAWGLRNTFAFDWLADGRMVGADNGERAGDEVNVLTAGANYGWPPEADAADAVAPVTTWPETFAPAGLAAVPPGWGPWSDGEHVLACGVVANRMDLVDLGEPGSAPQPVLDGCPLRVAAGGDGTVLFSTMDAVWRITPSR